MTEIRKFDDVLDECLGKLLFGNETVEQCLQRFPAHAAELKPLLETALDARQALAFNPRPEFKELSRRQFNMAVRDAEAKKSNRSFSWGWRPVWAVAVSVFLVFLLAGGATVAASRAMPDSPLYAVKRATERVQLALTFSDIGKAELHTALADERVTEIIYLAEKDEPDRLALASEELSGHLSEISLLTSPVVPVAATMIAPQTERTAAPADASPVFPTLAPRPGPVFAPTQPVAPPAPVVSQDVAASGAEKSAEAAQADNVTEMSAFAAIESPEASKKASKETDSKDDRKSKLKATVISQAEANIARLRAQLETAPASARPALSKALARAEEEYKKAIEALE